jgi:hypothetical protein
VQRASAYFVKGKDSVFCEEQTQRILRKAKTAYFMKSKGAKTQSVINNKKVRNNW